MTVIITGLKQEDVIGLRATFRESTKVLPPHGRLIDADELVADIKGQAERMWTLDAVSERDYFIERNEKFRQAMFKSWCESMFAYLDTRPTIIEADDTIKTPLFDIVEEHDHCHVQVLRNSITGEVSVGWWEEKE